MCLASTHENTLFSPQNTPPTTTTHTRRAQLLRAVKLLTKHITSLPERLKYMCQIVQLDSLGAPERLEVTARLLLDLRDQLHPVTHPVKVRGCFCVCMFES
jgi:hypothetical protein